MNAYLIPGFTLVWTGNFAFLVMATGFIRLIRARLTLTHYRELVQRVRSWWLIFGIFTVLFFADVTIFLVFLTLLSFLAFREFVSIIPTWRSDRKAILLAYLCIPIQYFWISQRWYGLFIVFIPVFMFLGLQACFMTRGETKHYLKSFSSLYFGLMTAVFSLSHLGFLINLPVNPAANYSGACIVVYLLVLTQLNDVSQYIWGKCFGNKKVTPQISPDKTRTGLIGGIVTTVFLSLLMAPVLTPFPPSMALIAGILISITGFFGDLSISAIKRDLGIKNTGSLLPGHGGILDRVDSLTFTAPVFFYVFYFYSVNSGYISCTIFPS